MWASRDDVLVLNYYAAVGPTRLDFNVKIRDRKGGIQTITGTATSFTTDRTLVLLVGDQRVNEPGEVVAGGVMGDWTGVKRGAFYCLLSLQKGDVGNLICKGYKYENNWLGLGEFRESLEGPGRIVNNEADTTLGNNNSVTRTLTVPTNTRWLLHAIHVLNADNVTRNIDVSTTDGTDPTLQLWRASDEASRITPAGESLNLPPGTIQNDEHVSAGGTMDFPMEEGDTVVITWNAGGASTGGTAKSSVVVEEWIEA